MALSQADLDLLWDFADAVASESRLRAAAGAEADSAVRAEYETQIARALGLQERYAEADAVLDAVDSDEPAARARVALERGRLRTSSGDPDAAVPLFRAAEAIAADASLTFLDVDALHMLAIADPARVDEHTSAALAILDRAGDARTQRWRVALHTNLGWTHYDEGGFAPALTAFERARSAAVEWGTPQQVQWADEAIAEARSALRSGRHR